MNPPRRDIRDYNAWRDHILVAAMDLCLQGKPVTLGALRAYGVQGDRHKVHTMLQCLIVNQELPADCVEKQPYNRLHSDNATRTLPPPPESKKRKPWTIHRWAVRSYWRAWRGIHTHKEVSSAGASA